VRHKEQFKRMFRMVDMLTLSATPIPRTLYVALMGARDMSTIDTAPLNRLPVQTAVCPYNEELITRAIERELAHKHRISKACIQNLLCGSQNSHRDRQVEARALLAEVGRGEVYNHLLGGHTALRVLEGGANTLLALLHGIVGQAHKVEAYTSARNIHLDLDLNGLDAYNRTRKTPYKHRLLLKILY
jgi:hypothetical protein